MSLAQLVQQIQAKIQVILAQVNLLKTTNKTMSNPQKIYQTAKAFLDKHITLDETVSPDLGCAEAVSYVLSTAGIPEIPTKGIAGTSQLYSWLKEHFDTTEDPQAGDVVISPSGTSKIGTTHGHTGIVAQYGILSNDSDTGLFMEKYTEISWQKYFGDNLGFPVFYFRARG